MPTPFSPLTVSVRSLCEFAAKHGDLDHRFTPSASAEEGMAGHAVVASRRPAHWQSELRLSGEFEGLQVRGRADGFDPVGNALEEVKTFRGDLARMPANHRHLHWAQLKVYGWLACASFELGAIDLRLVYFDVATQVETVLVEPATADGLRQFFEVLCRSFITWAAQEAGHRAHRDASLAQLRFPHPVFRAGQRDLSASAFNAARSGRCLLAQAPTGSGKTIGTVFPLLKACPVQKIDKIFFLTAKGSGRRLALDAIAQIAATDATDAGLPLRVLELVARDKACEHPDKACHGDSCPLARGFYDRLPGARQAAAQRCGLDRDAVRAIAREHAVCPYYLAQEMVRWSDVIVGDYNHYFDDAALLHALTLAHRWRVGVLVDEAHNLVERARRMYSAELRSPALQAALRVAPPAVRKPLARLDRVWRAVAKPHTLPYQVMPAIPPALADALQRVIQAITAHQADHPAELPPDLLGFYFDALRFARLLESFGSHSLFDLSIDAAGAASCLSIRNVLPAPFLAPRFGAATVLFSATLAPQQFYRDTLGLPADTAWIDVATAFAPEQLTVHVARHVSTRYRHRDASLQPIAELMARQYRALPGNYLAFFSSFDYLARAAQAFASNHPAIPAWEQGRHMNDDQRRAFLDRFHDDGAGIGFAVLGGAFAEGIDLPGKRLIGAFIATLGLPQVNPVNEEFRRRVDQTHGAGYDYVYLYPGIRKVVQAAGRVIRSPQDRGVVHLIDDRFDRPEVRRLLPAWWTVEDTGRGG